MTLIQSIASWRPRTPFYYGWLILGTAAVATYSSTGVTQLVMGGIQTFILEDTGWDRSTIAFTASSGTWVAGFVTPFVGRLADRYGPRMLMPAAAFVVGVCFFAIAETSVVWQFYVANIAGRAIANPFLIGVVPRTAAVNFFQRRRSLAIGISAMARPIGGAINIQLISIIAVAFSWRAGYQYMGALALAMVIPLFLIMRRRPEDIGLQPDGDAVAGLRARPGAPHTNRPPLSQSAPGQTQGSVPTEPGPNRREFDWRAGEAIRTSTFWFIVLAEAFIVMTSSSVNFQVVPYLIDSGLSRAIAAGALSISSLLGALANPLWGVLSDRYSPKKLMISVLALAALFALLFLLIDSPGQNFFIVTAWGASAGGLTILGSMMIANYFGRASYGSITGIMGPVQTGALGLGPIFGALLISFTGSYTALFISALAAYCVAFVLIYSIRTPTLPRRATQGAGD
jgi:sugar phosphate permease